MNYLMSQCAKDQRAGEALGVLLLYYYSLDPSTTTLIDILVLVSNAACYFLPLPSIPTAFVTLNCTSQGSCTGITGSLIPQSDLLSVRFISIDRYLPCTP